MILLDEAFHLLLKCVAIFYMVPFDLMKLTPLVGFRPHDVWLRGWRQWNVMHMMDITPYLLRKSVQRHETFCSFPASFECFHVSNKYDVMILTRLPWVFRVTSYSLFDISGLCLAITFATLYIVFYMCHYLHQGSRWPLGEGFIKMSHP